MDTHPSKDITGSEGNELKERNVVLCVSGSVAVIKSPEIARCLMRHGANVFAVMTKMSQLIIHPFVMEWATGNPVVTELTGKIEHVTLVGERAEKADLVLVAPATANTISKIACGIDDTPVTSTVSTAFGSKTPLVIVPAMHESMYNHPIVTENIQKLKDLGVEFVEPRIEEGKAKIAEPEEIANRVILRLTAKKDFSGKRVLVTAGATVEHIDPIRVITNMSSGKMGTAVTEEALIRGAETTLIYGAGRAAPPKGARMIPVETTAEMCRAVVDELKSRRYDIVVAVAAAGDWTPEEHFKQKVSTHSRQSLTLKLVPTKKIINEVKKARPTVFLVAFRAEHAVSRKELVDSAFEELKTAKADLVVANDVSKKGAGFNGDTSEVLIIDRQKRITNVPLTTKREIARRIFDIIKAKTRPK